MLYPVAMVMLSFGLFPPGGLRDINRVPPDPVLRFVTQPNAKVTPAVEKKEKTLQTKILNMYKIVTKGSMIRSTKELDLMERDTSRYQCMPDVRLVSKSLFYKKTRNQSGNVRHLPKQQHFWRGEGLQDLPEEILRDSVQRSQSNFQTNEESQYFRLPKRIQNVIHTVCAPLSRQNFVDSDYAPHFKPTDRAGSVFIGVVYFDVRIKPNPQVRAFGLAPLNSPPFYCQLACSEHPDVAFSVRSNTTDITVLEELNIPGVWQQRMYTCELPFQCTPTHVTLTTRECTKPVNIFPVKVTGNAPTTPRFSFGICTSIAFDMVDSDVSRLVEFIEVHRYFGAQIVYLYDTYNTSELFESTVRAYEETGFVKRIPWRIPEEVQMVFYFAQVLQYNDCIYRHMDEAAYLGLFDIDEAFVPSQFMFYQSVMAHLQHVTSYQNIAAFHFKRHFLCKNGTKGTEGKWKKQRSSDRLVTFNIPTRTLVGGGIARDKQVVVPRGVVLAHVHHLEEVMRDWQQSVTDAFMLYAAVHHYRGNMAICAKPLPRLKALICPYITEIHSRVVTKLIEFDLLVNPPSTSENDFVTYSHKELPTNDIALSMIIAFAKGLAIDIEKPDPSDHVTNDMFIIQNGEQNGLNLALSYQPQPPRSLTSEMFIVLGSGLILLVLIKICKRRRYIPVQYWRTHRYAKVL